MLLIGCILVGLVAGFFSALLGIGGGVVIVPMLLMLLGLDMKVAVGTSLACVVPIAVSGALFKHGGGQVDWLVVLYVLPFGVLGVFLGDKVSDISSDLLVKRLFGVLLFLIALKMVLFPGGWEGVLHERGNETALETPAEGAAAKAESEPGGR
jgi:hypothetical protein